MSATATAPPKPARVAVAADAIPAELRALPSWVAWRWTWKPGANGKPGKWDKPPFKATSPGALASTTDQTTWSTFAQAVDAVTRGRADGVGLVFAPGSGIVGWDIDRCRDPLTGAIAGWAQEIIDVLAGHVEVSPSGTGIHVLTRAVLPVGATPNPSRGGLGPDRVGKVELFTAGKYLTVTGARLAGSPAGIPDRQDVSVEVFRLLFPAATSGTNGAAGTPTAEPDRDADWQRAPRSDEAVLMLARTAASGAKFRRLYDEGDLSEHDGDDSRADAALCETLAFWTEGDAEQIERLFTRSALCREKWTARQDYRARTIAKAVAWWRGRQAETATEEPEATDDGARGAAVTVEEPESAPAPYTFTPAFPPGHFVADYITYAADRTDAALEYHEAAALVLLAAATPRVRAKLKQYVRGFATNLYVLLLGSTTKSRKSTAKDFGVDLIDLVAPALMLPDQDTPEGFIEKMAERQGDSAIWPVDEWMDQYSRMRSVRYMDGLAGKLLTIYDGRDFTAGRRSKRDKVTGARVADDDVVTAPHLSILACATPTLFEVLVRRDVRSGLLPRFAIVMPEGKPPRKPLEESLEADGLDARRQGLATWVATLRRWSRWETGGRRVRFAPGAMATLDRFAAALEDAEDDMLQRLSAMTFKVAVLGAAGRPDVVAEDGPEDLTVTVEDAEAAIAVATRWRGYAEAFAERVGETAFERDVQRAFALLPRVGASIDRRTVAQRTHLRARELEEVERTLVMRGAISVEQRDKAQRGPAAGVWKRNGNA